MALDPDMSRPRFRPPYEDQAEDLLHGAAARFDEKPDEWVVSGQAKNGRATVIPKKLG